MGIAAIVKRLPAARRKQLAPQLDLLARLADDLEHSDEKSFTKSRLGKFCAMSGREPRVELLDALLTVASSAKPGIPSETTPLCRVLQGLLRRDLDLDAGTVSRRNRWRL